MNRPPATAIGNSFVAAYYNTLNKTPNEVHLYYHTESSLARLSQDAESSDDDIATGVENIEAKIKEQDYNQCKVAITSIDSQYGMQESVIVLVHGVMSNDGWEAKREFVQTFLLAQQSSPNAPPTYFVLNDVLRYVAKSSATQHVRRESTTTAVNTEIETSERSTETATPSTTEAGTATATSSTSTAATSTTTGTATTESNIKTKSEESKTATTGTSENRAQKKKEKKPRKEKAPKKDAKESATTAQPNAPSKTTPPTASAPAAAAAVAPPAAVAAPPQNSTWATRLFTVKAAPAAVEPVKAAPQPKQQKENSPAVSQSKPTAGTGEEKANGVHKDAIDYSTSVVVQKLPEGSTAEQIEDVFKAFGKVVDVYRPLNKSFGFVSFESASGVELALAALPIEIAGVEVVVEKRDPKRSRAATNTRTPNADSQRGRGRGRGRGRAKKAESKPEKR